MVDFGTNVVDLVTFIVVSLVFAEIYSRFKVRWGLRHAENAIDAFSRGQKTSGSRFIERLLIAFLSLLVRPDDEGKWHLTKTARIWGARAIGAIAELVQVRGPKGGAPGLGGLDLANLGGLDMDQLIGVGIGMLPKKQQGMAAMIAGVGVPLLKRFMSGELPAGKKSTGPTTITSNPFLKDGGL